MNENQISHSEKKKSTRTTNQPLQKIESTEKQITNEHSMQYQKYRKRMNLVPQTTKQNVESELMKYGIKWHSIHSSFQKIIVNKVGSSIKFSILLGNFQITLLMLKVSFSSDFLYRAKINEGNFGSIFLQNIEDQNFVIKSQKIQRLDKVELNQNIDRVLHEIATTKIASALKIGPKYETFFGYDAICFENSIQFSMELCFNKHEVMAVTKMKHFEEQLIYNLKKMHFLRIIHCDIKPSNIAWSPSFCKWILLDFGFAKYIQEMPGFKTATKFIGTYNYSSQSMRQLYHLNIKGRVDLYSNDIYGLQKVFNLPINQTNVDELKILEETPQLKKMFFQYVKFKYHLFEQTYHQLLPLFNQSILWKQEFCLLLVRESQRLKKIENKQNLTEVKNIITKLEEEDKIIKEKTAISQEIDLLQKNQTLFLKKYIMREEFVEEEEWESIFLEESFSKFQETIQDNWENYQFFKKLILFIQQVFFSNCLKIWERLDYILEIIGRKLMISMLPTTFNFSHQLKNGNKKQAKQIYQDLFEMWSTNLEDVTEQIFTMCTNFNFQTETKKQVELVLNTFCNCILNKFCVSKYRKYSYFIQKFILYLLYSYDISPPPSQRKEHQNPSHDC